MSDPAREARPREDFRPPWFHDLRPLRGWLAASTLGAVALLGWTACSDPPEPQRLEQVPDRFTKLALPEEPRAGVAAPVSASGSEPQDPKPAGGKAEQAGEARDDVATRSLLLKTLSTRGASASTDGDAGDLDAALGGVGTVGTGLGGGGTGSAGLGAGDVDIGDLGAFRTARPRLAVERGGGEANLAVVRAADPTAGAPSAGGTIAAPPEAVAPSQFVTSTADSLSTFAVDVDTASFTMARNQLASGYLPAPGAVRVEEFVNWLPYEYARPRVGPFGVDVDGAPSPFHRGRHLVRIGVQGKTVSAEERKPAHLTFLVDVSGSMSSGDKIGLVKQSLGMLVDELQDGDTVAIVTYAGANQIVLEPTSATDKARIHRAIATLSTGGGTAMASGIYTAYELAWRTFVPGTTNRVILASDGDANIGASNPRDILPTIRRYADQGVALTTLGFGTGNYRDGTMERLADEGDGNYYYIDGEREARRVLVDRLASTTEVLARDVKIQVAWDPSAVKRWRLVGYENRDVADRDFRNDAVDAGEVGPGHQVTALYELELTGAASERLGEVRLRYEAPGPQAPAVERSFPVATASLRPSLDETRADTRMAVAAGWLAEVLRGSSEAKDVSLAQIAAIARKAQRVEYAEQDGELLHAIEQAMALGADDVPERVAAARSAALLR